MPNHMQFVAFWTIFGNFHDYTLLEMNFSKKSGIFTGAGLVFLYDFPCLFSMSIEYFSQNTLKKMSFENHT